MAFNFPNTPTEGQLFTDSASGAQYRYTNGVWMQVSAAQIKLNDVRNRVINGAMQHSQENSTSVTTTAAYPADQWQLGMSSSSTIYAVRSNPAAGSPSTHLLMQASPVEAAAAAGEYVQLYQIIEGTRLADIGLGLSSHKQIVIAFDTKLSVAGTYWVALGTFSGSHTWLGSYTISAGEVDTWVRKTVVIPAGALNAGTWSVDNTGSAVLHFTYHCGTSLTGVAGFQAANVLAGPGQALGLSVAAGCALSNVGLYSDAQNTGAAPPWEMPDYATELAACMRYYQKSSVNNLTIISGAYAPAATGSYHFIPLSTRMRTGPTMSMSGVGYSNGTNLTFNGAGVEGFQVLMNAVATGAYYGYFNWAANARM